MKINRQQLLEDYEDEELVDSIIADATEGINEKNDISERKCSNKRL